MIDYALNRRNFLAASALAMANLGPRPAGAGSANEAITLGFIGVGGMGSGLLDIFRKMPDVRVAAVCDVYEPHRGKAKAAVGGPCEAYGDFRHVLDRKDIDAVVIATPDHWHAIPAILACQAGKDVYCEKPLAYRIGEGRAMVDAAAKHKRITQMGNLIHATENYRRVVEIVQSGVLGPIGKCRVWMANDYRGLGKPADTEVPAGADYDFWLGPAPSRPFNPLRFTFNWRWFWDYGGGVLSDFCCHIIDLVHWAMDVEAPETIAATGGRYILDDIAETPDTLEVAYHYKKGAKGFDLVWSQTSFNTHGLDAIDDKNLGLGIEFQGTNGTLVANYGSYKIIPEAKGEPITEPPKTLPRSPGHHREWLDGIKSRTPCPCRFEYGHRLTSVGQLGNIALLTGEKLRWDAEAERVTNHAAANAYLLREEYRAPWSLPKV